MSQLNDDDEGDVSQKMNVYYLNTNEIQGELSRATEHDAFTRENNKQIFGSKKMTIAKVA